MTKHQVHSTFRTTPAPRTQIPLGARSVGWYRLRPGYRERPVVKHFVQIFWGVRGTGALVIQGLERELPPRHIALYLPGMEHHVYSLGQPWEYRWWTMDGPLAASLTTAFGLSAGVFPVGPAPCRQFEALTQAIKDITPAGERRASALAYELLACAAGRQPLPRADARMQAALELIHRCWRIPDFCVQTLAGELQMNRSSLSRRFHAHVGVSPQAYIHHLRIQHALSLLKSTELPVKAVAAACGWDDPNYFSRCIQQACGLSPKLFRTR